MIYSQEFDYFTNRTGLSALFQLLQDVSGSHCRLMGLSHMRLSQDGLMWVVVRHYAKIARLPLPGEHVTADTWHGGTKHMLFPRYYRLYGADGEQLVEGGAVWAMVDMRERRMKNPADYSLVLPSEETGDEPCYQKPITTLPTTGEAEFIVPQEYIDLNGHMNNTRYYDAAEDSIAHETAGLTPVEVRTSFIAELPRGASMELHWGHNGGLWYIAGESDHPIFKMNIRYE